MQDIDITNPNWWEIVKTVVPWIGGAIAFGLVSIAAVVAWGFDRIVQKFKEANDLFRQAQERIDKAHDAEIAVLKQQNELLREQTSEKIRDNYLSTKRALEEVVDERDRELEQLKADLVAAERKGHSARERQNELKGALAKKQRELDSTKTQVKNITSTVVDTSRPEVNRYLADQLAKVRHDRKEIGMLFLNNLLYWIEGDKNSFESVTHGMAGMAPQTRTAFHQLTSIPLRILEELRGIGEGAQEKRTQEEIRDDLILAVWLNRPSWRDQRAQFYRESTVVEPILPLSDKGDDS